MFGKSEVNLTSSFLTCSLSNDVVSDNILSTGRCQSSYMEKGL